MQHRYVLLRKFNRPSTTDYSLYIRDNVANYFLYTKGKRQKCANYYHYINTPL